MARTHEYFVVIDGFLVGSETQEVVFGDVHAAGEILAGEDLRTEGSGVREAGGEPDYEFPELNENCSFFRKSF